MSEKDAKLYEDIGYIKGKVDSMSDHLEKLNGTTEKNSKSIAKHDVIIGKVGLVITAVIFALTAAFNIGIEWIKTHI